MLGRKHSEGEGRAVIEIIMPMFSEQSHANAGSWIANMDDLGVLAFFGAALAAIT
jgi:hypothetical protein